MSNNFLSQALTAGYERIVAWADILDRINVYPVPDGDTGRNLVITLSVLRNNPSPSDLLIREILISARGNSGNIAARFLAGFLRCQDLESLWTSAEAGRTMAYQAVSNPQPGTMLSLFDTLAASLKNFPPEDSGTWVKEVISNLEGAVIKTTEQLPELKEAGVVDSGALGMLVFLDPLLNTLAGRPVEESFFIDELKNALDVSSSWQDRPHQGYCLDVVLKIEGDDQEVKKQMAEVGESLVVMPGGDYLKIHLHAPDREKARQELTALGSIVNWSEDDLGQQTLRFTEPRKDQCIHLITDAAGSISRDLAQDLGITLLNSYITMDLLSLPETYVDSSQLFRAMRGGVKVSTSQASDAERRECYHKIMKVHDRVLYLCVGSFYTGNYLAVMKWKSENDPENRMIVIDSGVASGKLGLAAKTAAEMALMVKDPEEVIAFAKDAVQRVQEYIFLDKLHFLAAGGRMSRTGAFFGDVLNIKPIISPFPDGARKLGVVRSLQDQVKFAFRSLEKDLPKDQESALLLEYSDNRDWLEREIKPEIERRFPLAEVTLQLLSLTSAAHMGPGSWGIAFLPRVTRAST
jgi:DegV family protein with EDD domain